MSRTALWRTALLPAFPGHDATDLQRALTSGGVPLEAVILRQHLGPLWHAHTCHAVFADSRRRAVAAYMAQQAAVRDIDDRFNREGIVYAVIKGAGTRELLYDDPALRECTDVDVLVAPHQSLAAARVLTAAGYRLKVEPSVVSHEVGLVKGDVSVDLHWDILRPGRTRTPVVDGLLARRHRHGHLWMLSDSDALFLMLVHAAIAKHVSPSLMGLHRVADIARWWQRRQVDWPVVLEQLEACGMKTAAWTVLTWVRMVMPESFSADPQSSFAAAIDTVRPGPLRAAYLKAWLSRDGSTRRDGRHAVRLAGFSTFLHDRPADAWRALRARRATRRTQAADTSAFLRLQSPVL